jgi:NAD(P)-dependent dehydrogenase (short-subunit alcohol dehydrogenase family)
LTGHLLGMILTTPGARVVNVSSSAHRMGSGSIDFENLNAEKGYSASGAYAQSKLANLLFTLALNERFQAIEAEAMATSAHPGWTVTGLQRGLLQAASRVIGQRPPMGALPTLRAAIDPQAKPNDYYGPGGLMEMRGHPVLVDSSKAAKDIDLARKLWVVSEALTAVRYQWPTPESAQTREI